MSQNEPILSTGYHDFGVESYTDKKSNESGYSLESGCLIKGTEADDLYGFDINLIGIETGGSLKKNLWLRCLYLHLQ